MSGEIFSNNLHDRHIDDVRESLMALTDHPEHVDLDQIDTVVNKINDILTDTAKHLNVIKQAKHTRVYDRTKRLKKNKSKPWYTMECKKTGDNYKVARIKAKTTRTSAHEEEKRTACKLYKQCIKRHYNHHQTAFCNKIRSLKSTDPKAYWKVINDECKESEQGGPSCKVFFDFFKDMNASGSATSSPCKGDDSDNIELNVAFTEEELKPCFQKLKNDKACGDDLIINEFLKHSTDKMLTVYTLLFNLILATGVVPSCWTIGVIKPIYKCKGKIKDPNNYRGITILSCFGKLFTSALNARLNAYVEKNKLLGKEQVGFRAGCSTVDHLFTLHSIVEIILYKAKRLYCAFLDYEKAFDKIDRAFLWQKLLANNINGKILNVIKNMYLNAKSCVRVDNETSDFFQASTGVRQGENLSPLLFALFLNDLKEHLSKDMHKLETLEEMTKDLDLDDINIDLIVKLFILLYADDTIICAENPEQLQVGLDCVKTYCDQWKLKLNANKCKVVIFSRGKVRNLPQLHIGNETLEIVFNFGYLGLKLNYNNKFTVAQKDLYSRASRAMFALLKKCNRLSLPLDIIFDLFDKTIVPVLTYGCEVWGTAITDASSKLQLKFYKLVLRLRQSTPTCMVLGEVGKAPVEIHIKSRVLGYWYKLCHPENENKIASVVYHFLLKLYNNDKYEPSYIRFIKKTLQEIGMNDLWLQQNNIRYSCKWFKEKVNRGLLDKFIQQWFVTIDNDGINYMYRMFKTSFNVERYFSVLPTKLAIRLARFRTTNNVLPVNTLRFTSVPRNERLCTKCNIDIGDEFHFLFNCPYFNDDRKRLLPSYFQRRPNAIKFEELFQMSRPKLLKLTHFVHLIQNNLG